MQYNTHYIHTKGIEGVVIAKAVLGLRRKKAHRARKQADKEGASAIHGARRRGDSHEPGNGTWTRHMACVNPGRSMTAS